MKKAVLSFLFLLLGLIFITKTALAINGDINGDGQVNVNDVWQVILKWGQNNFSGSEDVNNDQKINLLDLGLTLKYWGGSEPSPQPSSPPYSPPPSSQCTEWNQHACNAQRSGYINEEPNEPWTFAWHWEPNSIGTEPPAPHPVVGAGLVFMPYGNQGIYFIDQNSGQTVGQYTEATFNAAPAYSNGYLYAGATNGHVYKINTSTKQKEREVDTGGAINTETLLVGNDVYVTTDNGLLVKINTANMTKTWAYTAGSAATTGPAYSASRQIIIFGTHDLNVHAVNENGTPKWVKRAPDSQIQPGSNDFAYTYKLGWPVVADTAGVVLIKMRLGYFDSWLWPKFPTSNAAIRSLLESDPQKRSLFALNLDDGFHQFTPAVGGGGVDCYENGSLIATIGPMPAIRTLSTGKQVAYTSWRHGDTADSGWDARWDSHMGEMVLDNDTVNDLSAGDLRFVNFDSSSLSNGMITDEQGFVSIAGKTILHAHWGASENFTVTSLDTSQSNPISTQRKPWVIRRLKDGNANNQHEYSGSSCLACDTRCWPGESGFWVYKDQADPPQSCNDVSGSYHACYLRRYTFVSNGKIFVVGNGGDIFALNHN